MTLVFQFALVDRIRPLCMDVTPSPLPVCKSLHEREGRHKTGTFRYDRVGGFTPNQNDYIRNYDDHFWTEQLRVTELLAYNFIFLSALYSYI